jgi:hypothetical protein
MVLIEARGALVTKDEFLSRVWPDTVVEENNLVVQISALRRALGEDRDFIRTVSGRGYRFVAEIRASAATSDAETGWTVVPPRSQRSSLRRTIFRRRSPARSVAKSYRIFRSVLSTSLTLARHRGNRPVFLIGGVSPLV